MLGALASIITIWILVAWLIIEAIERVHKCVHGDKFEIDATVMLITSVVSLICNILNLIVLGHCCNSSDSVLDEITSVFRPHGNHDCGQCSHSHGHKHDHKHDHEPTQAELTDIETSVDEHHHHHHEHEQGVKHSHHDYEEVELESPGHKHHHHDGHSHDHHHEHEHGGHDHSAHHHHNDDHEPININVQAAIVHLIGDLLQSIGVIIAALVIMFKPNWLIVDPLCTFLFSILVMFTTIPTFMQCFNILMECTPSDVRTDHIRGDILAMPEVDRIDDFHLWGLAGDKFFLTAHIVLNRAKLEDKELDIVQKVHDKCLAVAKRNNICHSTFQIL